MTLEGRKRLLLVACTIDRLNLLAKTTSPPQPAPWYEQLTSAPWMDAALSVAMRLLPKELRLISTVWRLWSRRHKR